MTIPALAFKGLRDAASRPKMVFVLWLGNLLAALPLYLLFAGAFGAAVGASGLGRGLAARTDMNLVVEILTTSGPAWRDLARVALGLALIYEIAAIFFSGGILEVLLEREGKPFGPTFFSGAGRFGRFFRVSVFSLLLWIPAGALFFVVDGILSAVGSDPNREQLGFDLMLARYALLLALFHFIRMMKDYARIRMAVTDSRGALAALGRAAAFVMRRLGRTLGLYYLLGVASLALLAAFVAADSALSKTTSAAILAGFVLTQLFVAARSGLRIAYLGAQTGFYLREVGRPARPAAGSASAAQDARGEVDQGAKELQARDEGDADQPERQQEKPDQGVEKEDEQGQGPTDDKQDQP